MTKKIGFLKENLGAVALDAKAFEDKISSLALFAEALKRGFTVFHFSPQDLAYEGTTVRARAQKILTCDLLKKDISFAEKEIIDLGELDIIIIRLDPPFDMEYVTATYMLDKIKHKTLILNDPTSIRNFAEKLYPFDFSEYSPATLVSADKDAIHDFRERYGDIILKPLYEYGGGGVLLIKKEDKNLSSAVELLYGRYKTPIIAQEFIKEAAQGDKRIVIIDGEIIGALNRLPGKTDVRNNIKSGGSLVSTKITDYENEICKKLIPYLEKYNIFICGLDIVGNKVTEINVTSPGGCEDMMDLYGFDGTKIFWDAAIKRLG